MDDDEASASVPAPAWATPGVGRPSPLLEALTQIRSGLESARATATALSDVDCRDGVREFDQVLDEVESFWLELVADLDSRPGAVPGVRAGSVAVAFLAAGLNHSYSQAKKDVAPTQATVSGTAHREGQIVGGLSRGTVWASKMLPPSCSQSANEWVVDRTSRRPLGGEIGSR